ncbi:MAG: cobalt-precorrin-5B (C(1))-methyltransferase [Oligoflexia bacterium]|nr:cobalt-precorrin-5B (C(1))-methyltransferase [Oligoflexia bacterium]
MYPDQDNNQLRSGYTTGACAAAAAKAAAQAALTGVGSEWVTSTLPNREEVTFKVHTTEINSSGNSAISSVIKDAGDDPDCTNNAVIYAQVILEDLDDSGTISGNIEVFGGEGIALVTRSGLGLTVGSHAINPIPRRNIIEMVRQVLCGTTSGTTKSARVTIFVPNGQELAKHTINHRLGLVGGISILGTTGIVKPYSHSAYKFCVEQAIAFARAQGSDSVVLSTGGRSESVARKLYAHLPEYAFILVGDYVGVALNSALKNGIKRIILVTMVGKLTKMADGKFNTHVNDSEVSNQLLSEIIKEVILETGENMCESGPASVLAAPTARAVLETFKQNSNPVVSAVFAQKLNQRALLRMNEFILGAASITSVFVDFDGMVLSLL